MFMAKGYILPIYEQILMWDENTRYANGFDVRLYLHFVIGYLLSERSGIEIFQHFVRLSNKIA